MVRILGYTSVRQITITYGLILLMGLISFTIRFVKFDVFGFSMQVKMAFISIAVVSIFWETLRFFDRYLERELPFEKGIPKRVAIQLLLGVLTGAFLRACIYFFGEPYLPLKLDELFLATTWFLYMFLPLAINLGFFTNHFIRRWKNSIIVAERLEREKSQVQFDNLKNQLNPHFLFNALTSLNSLIHENQDLASAFLQQLSKVYRYVLKNKDRTIVPIYTELDFIQHYVSLLETRFQQALIITFELTPDVKDRAIVPVTLQVLIENALKHNIIDTERPLKIVISNDAEYLSVTNNVQLKKRVEDSNQVGLENLKNLYRFLSSKPVIIESTAHTFHVKVPLL